MNSTAYLIFHRDHQLDPVGINSGAEMATLYLARFLARGGKRVVLCAQLKGPEAEYDGVTFWDLGAEFDVASALKRADDSLGSYHLISAGRALPLMLAKDNPGCLSRVLISHDRASGDTGLHPRIVSKVADYIFHVSEAQRELFVRDGTDPAKSIVIHNGVDLDLFKAGDPEKRDMRRLVFVGALVVDKGLHLLVQSFAKLRSRYPDLKLDVYGTSSLWDREEYLNPAEIQRSVPGITFHGKVPQSTIARALQEAALCVIPSIWFDPFPLVSIDAQACGCPVVAFDVGGLKEGIYDGKTGVVIPEINEESLTKTLDRLLADPAGLKALSSNALSLSRPRFTWEKLVEKITSYCEKNTKPKTEKVQKKLGFLSTWNQECGMATYGRYLMSQFDPGSYVILAEEIENKPDPADEDFVARCWKRGQPNFDKLERAITEHDIGLLYLNCQYRFFPQPAMADFLKKIRARGIKVVVHLHNTFTLDPQFSALVTAADHVVVHSKESRLEAIANGASPDCVSAIPHGVHWHTVSDEKRESIRKKHGISAQEKLLLSFGFVQPHKGMDGLVEAVAQLHKSGLPVKGLIAGTAMPEDPNSQEYLTQLKKFAKELGVSDKIVFVDRFLGNEELGDYIATADLVLMNYRSQHYEASGACSLAVGAGAIVAASLAPPFQPFGDAVWHLSSGYPVTLSLGLLLTNQSLQSELKSKAESYRKTNSWQQVSRTIKGLMSDLGFTATKTGTKAQSSKGELQMTSYNTPARSSKASGLRVLMQNRSNTFLQRGGDTVVVERTKEGLERRGVKVTIDLEGKEDPKNFDLVHLFNFALPDLVKYFGERAKAAGKPFVVTTLYEDIPSFHNQSIVVGKQLIQYVQGGQSREWYQSNRADIGKVEKSGYFDNTWAARNAAVLLPNGAREAETLQRDYPGLKNISVVPVGYDIGVPGDADAFYREYGVRDFILCVGRLETRKNQLMLLKALEDTDIPVVFAAGGFSYQPEYENAVRSFRRKGRNIVLGRLSPEMLASAYAAAKVHAIPSWYELPGLVSLEAAYYGCNVVVTDRGTSKDYFGDKAFYCNPASEDSVRMQYWQRIRRR